MKSNDLFAVHTSSKRLNEGLQKTFGKKLNLENFNLDQLQDARNKIRTQISQVRNDSGFNENLENDAYHEAKFMLDALNAEIMEREEFIADPHQATVEYSTNEDEGSMESEVYALLKKFEDNAMEIGAYGDPDAEKIVELLKKGDIEGAAEVVWYSYADQDGGEVPEIEPYVDDLQAEFEELVSDSKQEYGNWGEPMDGGSFDMSAKESSGDLRSSVLAVLQNIYNGSVEGEDMIDVVADELGDYFDDVNNSNDQALRDAYQLMRQDGAEAEGDPEMMAQIAKHAIGMLDQADVGESAPPTAKGERMVKHIKKGYADDGKLTDKEKSIAYATAWKQHNKNESIDTTGEDMRNLREGEIQQASAIVTAKTMVDRVGRWIEELSGMENDTLLQLGDSIRDEMSADQAKTFISTVAPAIQQALQNLKDTRETLATGVRTLTGEEQAAGMLGAEAPGAAPEMGGDEFGVEPDAMNAPDLGADEFGAADAAVGGVEAAGREQRESINFQNRLMKVLAG